MKKALLLMAATMLLTFSTVCVYAEDFKPDAQGKYTVEYKVGEQNAAGMYGMIAIKGTDSIIDTSNLSNIYYIDQTSADADGVILFADFAPKGVAPDQTGFEECTVFIGGPGYDTAEQIGTLKKAQGSDPVVPDVPVDPDPEEPDPEEPDPEEPDPEEPKPEEPTTFTLSGKVVSTVGTSAATVTVKDATGATVATAQADATDGTFAATVPAGEDYFVVITKTSFCSYTITGIDVAADVALGDADISSLAGDVDYTEDINFYDLGSVITDYNKQVEDAACPETDIDATKDINFYDLSTVITNYNKKAISKNFAQ